MKGSPKKPSDTVWESLIADMTHVRDSKNHKVVDDVFDTETTWDENLDEREFQECEFAKKYALDFAHGTAGHNRLMLIAKLCEMLDVYEEVIERMIRYADEGKL